MKDASLVSVHVRLLRGLKSALASSTIVVLLGALTVPASAGGTFGFTSLETSAPCVRGGPDFSAVPMVLPSGFDVEVLATEDNDTAFPDMADMHTLNETGAEAGKYLFHTHELRSNAAVSVTDLSDGTTTMVARRADWERLDGLKWTPWGTLIFSEEIRTNHPNGPPAGVSWRDPDVPNAVAGLVYEADVSDVKNPKIVVREQVGSRSHEGHAFDRAGNLYGIHEAGLPGQGGGAIYRFVPDKWGDLSSGKLYALKLDNATTKVGKAKWVELNQAASVIDSNAAANAVGATKFAQPEDLEVWADTLFVSVSDEHRVVAIDLRPFREADGEGGSVDVTTVWDYVKTGANAPGGTPQSANSFASPDNLDFDSQGYLYISEDVGQAGRSFGNDVWVAAPPLGGGPLIPLPSDGPEGMPDPAKAPFGTLGPGASSVVRFASLTDCAAEPSGPYFGPGGTALYIHIMHRGVGLTPTLPDLSLRITEG